MKDKVGAACSEDLLGSSPTIVFEPACHWVGHQKDGVITQATDG